MEMESTTNDTNETEKEKSQEMTLRERAVFFMTNITLEPLMLCYILPSVMAGLGAQNLNLEKACRVDLEYNTTICDSLMSRNQSGYSDNDEVQVQKLVAKMTAFKNIFQSLLPCTILLFIGSWSDRHKRRLPCITLPILGELVTMIGFLFSTYFFYQIPLFCNMLIESVPPGLTGGWFAMFLGVNSYISDISTKETRTVRIGALNLFTNISIPIGIAVSGLLLSVIGYYGIFTAGVILLIIGLIYGTMRVKDVPVAEEDKVYNDKGFIKDFFDISHLKKTFQIFLKKRENNGRTKVILCIILASLVIGPLHGEMAVLYLFLRYKFSWDEKDFSVYLLFHFISQLISTTGILLILIKKLKVRDPIIGLISVTSKILASICFAFAPTPAYFYAGGIIDAFSGTAHISIRSMLSKIVPAEEIGKVFSIYGVAEALMPLVYGPLYSLVYKNTIEVFPGTFFLVGAAMTCPCVGLLIYLYMGMRNDDKALAKKQKQEILAREMLIGSDDKRVNSNELFEQA